MTALNQNGESLTKDHCPDGRKYISLEFSNFQSVRFSTNCPSSKCNLISNLFKTELLMILRKELIEKM